MRTVVPTSHRKTLSLRLLSLAVLLAFSSLIGSCRSSDPLTPGPNEQPLVRTTIAGTVVNEAGLPVMGASVTAHGMSATTDKYGYFILQNVNVPQDRCVALAKIDGYFTGAKATIPTAGGLTEVKLFLMSHGARKAVSGSDGGTLSLSSASGTASVVFAPGGIVTSAGVAFTGQAQVAIKHLDPADPNFAYYFAGDPAAMREDGSRTDLVSYGVLRVDMRSASGEQLQPAPGKPAQVSYPIPASMQASAPSTMPLWFFDEQKGMWVEEGVATKQGNMYVGTVTHFTDWNCDTPKEGNADVTGTVTCNGIPMYGVLVRVGQRFTLTDANGHYRALVPANVDVEIVVELAKNHNLFGSSPVFVNLISRQAQIVDIALTSPCPSTVLGRLTDDEGKPISGRLLWTYLDGAVQIATSLDGTFRMQVPSNTVLALEAMSFVCANTKTFNKLSGPAGEETDLGDLEVCGIDDPVVGDIDISAFDSNAYISLSPDGSLLAISGYGNIIIRKTADGSLVKLIESPAGTRYTNSIVQFSADNKRFHVYIYGTENTAKVYDVATGNLLVALPIYSSYLMPDGESVLGIEYVGNDATLVKYGIDGQKIHTYANLPTPKGFSLVAITQDGSRAVLSTGQTVINYDLTTEAVLTESPLTVANSVFEGSVLSADGSRIAMRSYSSSTTYVHVIEVATGAVIGSHDLGQDGWWLGAAALHPNGTMLALQKPPTGGVQPPPVIIDAATGAVIQELSTDGDPGDFVSFYFSGNGQRLAASYLKGFNKKVRLWSF
jgi:hypothetical protein